MNLFCQNSNGLIYIILFVIFLGGCKSESTSSDSDEIPLGRFEGLVGIDQNAGLYEELAGYSYFYTNVEDTLLEIALESTLVSTTNKTYVYAFIKSMNMLTPGTYSFNNVDNVSEFFESGFSGLYISPEIGNGRSYYSESGTVTIESVSNEGVRGLIEGRFFYKAPTGKDEFTRVYTTLEAEFNAVYWNESLFFIEEE